MLLSSSQLLQQPRAVLQGGLGSLFWVLSLYRCSPVVIEVCMGPDRRLISMGMQLVAFAVLCACTLGSRVLDRL